MRFRHRALLGVFLLLIFSFSIGRENSSGQSAQVDDARSKLVQAFVLVQQADLQGASPTQISLLASNLNLALYYEENATELFAKNITASDIYATKSVNLSNATSVQALGIASTARTQALFGQVTAYSIAVAAGFLSALLVLEVHRLNDLVRKMKLGRMRLD
jgi:hypothetical protein